MLFRTGVIVVTGLLLGWLAWPLVGDLGPIQASNESAGREILWQAQIDQASKPRIQALTSSAPDATRSEATSQEATVPGTSESGTSESGTSESGANVPEEMVPEAMVPVSAEDIRLSYAPIVKKTAGAVVNIFTTKLVSSRRRSMMDDPFFRQFFGRDPFASPPDQEQRTRRVQNSLGSGVIVHPDGYIITNHHVIEGADEIKVVLADERELEALLLVSDEESDLAILKIEEPDKALPFLDTGDSDDLEVGDLVLAIGNPFGVGQTVTSGIVSATARNNQSISNFGFFIQTDAAINPGNSGGALVDMQGRLIGVNTAIFSRSGGSVGIGFAIPANRVRAFFNNVAEAGGDRLVRPWSGLIGRTIDPELASELGLERSQGVVVTELYPGGPADLAGLTAGDVILHVNDKRIRDTAELHFRLSELVVGREAQLSVFRDGGTVMMPMLLIEAPVVPADPTLVTIQGSPLEGVTLVNLSPAASQRLKLVGVWEGAVIESLSRYSLGARLGLRPGDVIVEINGTPVNTVAQTLEVLKIASQGNGAWMMRFYRDGRLRSVRFQF